MCVSPPVELGRGRSAIVYAGPERTSVRKVFVGDRASTAVLLALTGAPNPYRWCQAAIETAVLRRRVLQVLVHLWFGDALRLPQTHGSQWNDSAQAFEIRMELVRGRHLPLAGLDPGQRDRLPELRQEIMRPLQKRLRAAGFDGLVWQAGLGNPTATANFMLANEPDGSQRWVWIDLESGVPALFALDPVATLSYYLPKCIRHRRWLFDDVDGTRLRRYVQTHSEALRTALSPGAWYALGCDIVALLAAQKRWKAIPRHERGIEAARARGHLTEEQAEHYRCRPLRWAAVSTGTAARSGLRLAAAGVQRFVAAARWESVRARARRFVDLIASPAQRIALARRHLTARVRRANQRQHLPDGSAIELMAAIDDSSSATSLADFGVHLAIKPVVKALEYGVVPLLLAFGVLDLVSAAFLIAFGGSFARGLYTLVRCGQSLARNEAVPWTALALSFVPVLGNFAYPAQLARTGAPHLSRFIVLDGAAGLGRMVPIWGGADTLLEHLPNRVAALLVRRLARPVPHALSDAEVPR